MRTSADLGTSPPNLSRRSLEARLLPDGGGGDLAASIRAELRHDIRCQRSAAAALYRRSVGGGRASTADGATGPAAAPPPPTQTEPPPPRPSTWTALWALVTCSRANALLAAFPLAVASHGLGWGPVPTFSAAFLSLIPAALILGAATEDVADALGDSAGGLFNAAVGNVPEIAISVSSLRRGLYRVLATTLLGSVLSSLTLLLGCCYVAANVGAANSRACSHHGTLAVKIYSSLLLLSCAGLAVPVLTARLPQDALGRGGELAVSRGTAVLLLVMYGAFLAFTMGTHADPLEAEAEAAAAASAAEAGGDGGAACEADSDEGGDGRPPLPLPAAAVAMVCLTALIAVASELLTGSIVAVTATTGIPQALLSLVILPIAGNVCEHASAVLVAAKGKVDLAHSIALGSSLQVAALVLPLAVLIAWGLNIPFSLDSLDPLQFFMLTLAVIHQHAASGDGRSDWLTGCQLICLYVIVALPSAFMNG